MVLAMRRSITLFAQFQAFTSTLILLWVLCFATSAMAAKELPTAGGTTLYTQAIATFTNSGSAELQHITSALVAVKVVAVEAAQFNMQARTDITTGTTGQISLELKNTGNVDSEIQISARVLEGDFRLAHVQLYQDNDGEGRIDGGELPEPKGQLRLYRRGDTHAYILTGIVPRDASGSVKVELLASSDTQIVLAKTVLQIHATSAGNVITLKSAKLKCDGRCLQDKAQDQTQSNSQSPPRINYKIRASNIGHQPVYGMKAGDVVDGGHSVTVDGVPLQDVALIREKIPAGTRYVTGTANVGAGVASAQILYRNVTDMPYQYRTTAPANPAHIVEIAMAIKTKMYRGDWFNFQFDVEVYDATRTEILSEPSDIWFRETATAELTHKQDMRIIKTDINWDASPDLTVEMLQDAPFMAEKSAGSYTITVRNEGTRDSNGTVRVNAVLPAGVMLQTAQGNGWQCTNDGQLQTVSCSTEQLISQGQSATALTLAVMTDIVLPDGVFDTVLQHSVTVSGGGEAAGMQDNNSMNGSTRIVRGATLAGAVWQDDNQNGRLDANEIPLQGWRVQLLSLKGNNGEGNAVIREEKVDQKGQFKLIGIPTGGPYALRSLSPTGEIKSLPLVKHGHIQPTQEKVSTTPLAQLGAVQIEHLEGGKQYTGFDMPVLSTGIVYDVATQSPIEGAHVKLVADAPGFDPSHHLVGGKAAAVAVTDAAGRYYVQLTPDAPAGTYHYEVVADAYKGGVSTLYPPVATPLALPVGDYGYLISDNAAPPEIPDDAVYYLAFSRMAGSKRVVNNHIPMQREQALSYALVLRHEADRKKVELLDFVNYTLTLSHTLPSALQGFDIQGHRIKNRFDSMT